MNEDGILIRDELQCKLDLLSDNELDSYIKLAYINLSLSVETQDKDNYNKYAGIINVLTNEACFRRNKELENE